MNEKYQIVLNQVSELLKNLFSQRVADHIIPIKYNDNHLIIQCHNSDMMGELNKRAKNICNYLNDNIADQSINTIEFVSRN